jgi:hypothetical protein
MKRPATADRSIIRRRRGRPWGSAKGLPPRVKLRFSLAPETVQAIAICSEAAGMRAGQWLDFTIRDLAMGGQLLIERREKDLTITEVRLVTDLALGIGRAKTIDTLIASAAQSVRGKQGDRESPPPNP